MANLNYKWVEDDATLDCIAAISYNEARTNLGVFIRKDFIVTSENALEAGFKYPNYIHTYLIDGAYDKSKKLLIAATHGDIWGKTYFWVYYYENVYENNPLHDIMFLQTNIKVSKSSNSTLRRPYYLPVAKKYAIEEPSGWITGAFALKGKRHVNESETLVPIYYDDENVLVDCEEWFPRFWGYFICILNIDKYPVIQSGAPLIQNGHVFGIASFTLRKGKESIFAFTDLRPYRDLIYRLQ